MLCSKHFLGFSCCQGGSWGHPAVPAPPQGTAEGTQHPPGSHPKVNPEDFQGDSPRRALTMAAAEAGNDGAELKQPQKSPNFPAGSSLPTQGHSMVTPLSSWFFLSQKLPDRSDRIGFSPGISIFCWLFWLGCFGFCFFFFLPCPQIYPCCPSHAGKMWVLLCSFGSLGRARVWHFLGGVVQAGTSWK